MADFESTAFQPCKEWIAQQVNDRKTWEEIKALCVAQGDFEETMHAYIDDLSWPLRLNKATWIEFVDYYKGNLITVRNAEDEEVIAIDNGGVANRFPIPTGFASSWEKYKGYLSKKMSQDSITKLQKSCHWILNHLLDDTRSYGEVKGLVTGSVQSGKTANMELYEYYLSHKKSEFRDELQRRVKEIFVDKCKLATTVDKTELFDGINDLRYGEDNNKIRSVLQFYNIALLLEANNNYERFPFKALKVYNYDIEHVNPQTPDFDYSEKKEWLEDHKKYSSLSHSLISEIDHCLTAGLSDFDNVAAKVRTELGLDEHAIGNLVLLDSGLNRSYKNVCFTNKRKSIVEKLRNNTTASDENTPILPGTKWVFLKEYDAVDTNKIWTKSDVNTYTEDLGNKLYEFLK